MLHSQPVKSSDFSKGCHGRRSDVLHNNTNSTVVTGQCNIESVFLIDKIVMSMCCPKVNDEVTDFKFWSKEFL